MRQVIRLSSGNNYCYLFFVFHNLQFIKSIHIISMNLLLIIVIIASVVVPSTHRFLNTNIKLTRLMRERGWFFLDRMSFDEGKVGVAVTVQIKPQKQPYKDQFNTILQIVPQSEWNQQVTFKCDRNVQAKNLNEIDIASIKPTDILQIPITLKKQNNYINSISAEFPIKNSIAYHFIFKDCSRSILSESWRRESRIQFMIELKNGDLEYGSDQKINNYVLPLLIVVTIFMVYLSKRPKTEEFLLQEKDWANITMLSALVLNLIAIIFYWIGHVIYTLISGKFHGFFDFCYLLFHSLSESVLTALIIFVAFGWTVTFIDNFQFDLYVPIMGLLGILNLILTLLGKINDGHSDKYHMYDTIPSYLLVFFRLVTVLVFMIGVIKSYRASNDNRVANFYVVFGLLGGGYFLSLPLIMIMTQMLDVHNQKIFVFTTVELIKNVINVSMTWMTSSKNSYYTSIKLSNRSFMQMDNKMI